MGKFKKVSILLGTSVLSLGLFASIADASTTVNGQAEKVRIQVASAETVFTKEDLIKKFREYFPNQFDFLTNSDFQMSSSHIYPDDPTIRHDLMFTKVLNGKRLYGNVGFVGENLAIEYYHYQPPTVVDALFPAKVSKEEAKKVAEDFMKKFNQGNDYQLEKNTLDYYPSQILTEPIRYSFTFARTENQVPIADQQMEVSVLGNGEVVSFYKMSAKSGKHTFDDIKEVKNKEEIVQKVKENLSVELNYQIHHAYETGDRSVQLVYQPSTSLRGVHASSGKWMTTNGYTEDFPMKTKIEKITTNPLPPKQDGITVEEAKKIAEKFLAIDSDKVKLRIESIHEMENYNGQTVINVQYMYEYANGGSGASIEIDKKTGEIIQYYNIKDYLLAEIGEEPKKDGKFNEQVARTQAVNYLKEWAPSYLHNYAMPLDEPYVDERTGTYHFSFPRIVNGIVVIGDQISVSIGVDGSLNGLSVYYQEIADWPSIDAVITEVDAKAIFEEALGLKLSYINNPNSKDKQHYDLVYVPEFNEASYAYIDAQTGEWDNLFNRKDSIVISHPWAQEELNYLINAKVLDVKDAKDFNGDAAVSKGEAIKVLMNSLTYFYDGGYWYGQENEQQTYENIDPKHAYYKVIERAVEAGILVPDSTKFDVDSPITREELAVWYIRVLGFEQAAKNGQIFKLDFEDANKVQKKYTGYVALANSLELLQTENKQFNPAREVTYAELAVSTIRLAHEIAESGRGLRY